MSRYLSKAERETVIVMNDATGIATITTHQRPILTKLRKNPAAKEIADRSFGSSLGAEFEIDASLISIRTKKRKGRPGDPAAFSRRQGRTDDGR